MTAHGLPMRKYGWLLGNVSVIRMQIQAMSLHSVPLVTETDIWGFVNASIFSSFLNARPEDDLQECTF